MVSLVVAGGLYYLLNRSPDVAAERPTVAASEQELHGEDPAAGQSA